MYRYLSTFGLVLASFVVPSALFAEDNQDHEWQLMPSILLVTYFPGATISSTTPYGYVDEYKFSGVGFNFHVRGFHKQFPGVAFTFGGGINWFENVTRSPVYPVYGELAGGGVGETLKHRGFRTFPLIVGVEAILPHSSERGVMFFAGGSVGMHFVDGNLDLGQQAKFGYSLGGGFAVKIFEFAVRYYSFSDIKNIGASLGLRFNSFVVR